MVTEGKNLNVQKPLHRKCKHQNSKLTHALMQICSRKRKQEDMEHNSINKTDRLIIEEQIVVGAEQVASRM